MLKRVFVAPDPGRVRLRFAVRAVLGIGLAVALCGLAGHSLVAAITGGLAALLALFTVTDPTVRRQAVTTALLPVAAQPAPPEVRGRLRITTRQAVQATLGGAFAHGIGKVLSDERWYWAVGATRWVFVDTTSRGETLVRGFRRVLGTVIGIFCTAAVSYSWMMFFVLSMGRWPGSRGLTGLSADQAGFHWFRLMCGYRRLRQSVGGPMLTLC